MAAPMQHICPKVHAAVMGGRQVIFHSPAEEAKATAKIIKKSLGKALLIFSQSFFNAIPSRTDLDSGECYLAGPLEGVALVSRRCTFGALHVMPRCSYHMMIKSRN